MSLDESGSKMSVVQAGFSWQRPDGWEEAAKDDEVLYKKQCDDAAKAKAVKKSDDSPLGIVVQI